MVHFVHLEEQCHYNPAQAWRSSPRQITILFRSADFRASDALSMPPIYTTGSIRTDDSQITVPALQRALFGALPGRNPPLRSRKALAGESSVLGAADDPQRKGPLAAHQQLFG